MAFSISRRVKPNSGASRDRALGGETAEPVDDHGVAAAERELGGGQPRPRHADPPMSMWDEHLHSVAGEPVEAQEAGAAAPGQEATAVEVGDRAGQPQLPCRWGAGERERPRADAREEAGGEPAGARRVGHAGPFEVGGADDAVVGRGEAGDRSERTVHRRTIAGGCDTADACTDPARR